MVLVKFMTETRTLSPVEGEAGSVWVVPALVTSTSSKEDNVSFVELTTNPHFASFPSFNALPWAAVNALDVDVSFNAPVI